MLTKIKECGYTFQTYFLKELTYACSELVVLPQGTDTGFSFWLTGRDDVRPILGVNIFVSDVDLEMEAFSRGVENGTSLAAQAAFSTSEELR